MRLSNGFLITTLVLVVLALGIFLGVFLSRKMGAKEPEPSEELKKIKQEAEEFEISTREKLRKAQEDARREAQRELEELRARPTGVEEEIKRFSDQIKKTIFKDADGVKPTPATGPVTLVPILDVNLPEIGENKYVSGGHEVVVSRETSFFTDVVKYTHRMPSKVFNVEKVVIGGKAYPIPKHENVLLLTTMAPKFDPEYTYIITIAERGNSDICMYENDGTKFVTAGDIRVFREYMEDMAKKLGRHSFIPELSLPKISMNLLQNGDFQAENEKFTATQGAAFNDYSTFEYSHPAKKFIAKYFFVNDSPQTGLPTGKPVDSLTVYFQKDFPSVPIGVRIKDGPAETYYVSRRNGVWTEESADHFADELAGSHARLNNILIINVSRRSEYYRNGTGKQTFEFTKDVKVYVETNSPALEWSTFRHVLEVDDRETPFKVAKVLYGDAEMVKLPMEDCMHVNVYMKTDAMRTVPAGLSVKLANGKEKHYLLKNGKYEADASVTPQNLAEKLEAVARLQSEQQ